MKLRKNISYSFGHSVNIFLLSSILINSTITFPVKSYLQQSSLISVTLSKFTMLHWTFGWLDLPKLQIFDQMNGKTKFSDKQVNYSMGGIFIIKEAALLQFMVLNFLPYLVCNMDGALYSKKYYLEPQPT